jgi:hypothetical protein
MRVVSCPTCRGAGWVWDDPNRNVIKNCVECDGTGFIDRSPPPSYPNDEDFEDVVP